MYMCKDTAMAQDWPATRMNIAMKHKVCDKVGLPCARLLSIRQEPTCSPSKPWLQASRVSFRQRGTCWFPEAWKGSVLLLALCTQDMTRTGSEASVEASVEAIRRRVQD